MIRRRWVSGLDNLYGFFPTSWECASTSVQLVEQVRSQGYGEGRCSSHLGCGCMTFDLFLRPGVLRSESTCDRCVTVEPTLVMVM